MLNRRFPVELAIGLVAGWMSSPEAVAQETIAIVGATVIDGSGGEPLADATVVIEGDRIAALGPSASTAVPDGARVIDGVGKFLTPGFVDTNVHTSLYGAGFGKHRKENAVFFWERGADIALESAQMHLKHGVTHIRDSYGQLPQLVEVRDAIANGREVGPRMQVAGNIVGWGGAFSVTFSLIADRICRCGRNSSPITSRRGRGKTSWTCIRRNSASRSTTISTRASTS